MFYGGKGSVMTGKCVRKLKVHVVFPLVLLKRSGREDNIKVGTSSLVSYSVIFAL